MFDATLARKILNKIGKELVNAMQTAEGETRNEIQRALNDITFMYDILHLDEIEVMDISKNPQIKQRRKRKWELLTNLIQDAGRQCRRTSTQRS